MHIDALELAQRIAHDVAKTGVAARKLRQSCKWSDDEVLTEATTAAWFAMEQFDDSKGVPAEKWVAQAVSWRLTDQLRYELTRMRGRRQDRWALPVEWVENGEVAVADQADASRFARKLNQDAEHATWADFENAMVLLSNACRQGVKIMRCTRARRRLMEQRMLTSTLRFTEGCRTQAARILGIDRATLHRKLREWELDIPDTSEGAQVWQRSRKFERRLLASILKHAGGNVREAARIAGVHPDTIRSRMRTHRIEGGGDGQE